MIEDKVKQNSKTPNVRSYDWNLIKSFVVVLDEGTLSAAAKKLGISQPTLSRHMDELENSLGIVLFERGRNGAKPTSDALSIADNAREVEAATQALSLSATGKSEQLSGTVRITASQIVSTYLMPEIITRLIDVAPEIEVELVSTNNVESLTEREADIAVRMLRPNQPHLIARKVNEFRVGVYAHKSYLAKWGIPVTPEDLRRHRVLGYDKNELILDGFIRSGMQIDRNFFHFRCDDQVAYWRTICAGAGIGFGPAFLAGNEAQLTRIVKDLQIPSLPVWLVTHREVKTNRRIRKVYDFLADELAKLEL